MSVLELNGRVFDASTTGTLTLTGEGSATTNVTQGLCKHWIDYNGDMALQDSFNTASLTDNAAGQGTPTFVNNMSNIIYCMSNNSQASGTNTGKSIASGNATTSTYKQETYESDSGTDPFSANCAVHGDLA